MISQSNRCSEILKQISQKQIVDDKFLSLTTAEDLLEDIIKSFNETTDKKINLVVKKDFNKFKFERARGLHQGVLSLSIRVWLHIRDRHMKTRRLTAAPVNST